MSKPASAEILNAFEAGEAISRSAAAALLEETSPRRSSG